MTVDSIQEVFDYFSDILESHLGDAGCNDWEWPEDWTTEDKQVLWNWYRANNPDVGELRLESKYGPPDFEVWEWIRRQVSL